MKKSFKWHRTSISPKEYDELFSISKCSTNAAEKSKREKAYKHAADIRKFEIDLFWKRAAFFWAFITAIYTAYFNVLIKIYPKEKAECPPYCHGKIPLLVLSALGVFFCFSWLLSSYGSKNWQENWEKHLDLLEDEVTGPLYKTYSVGSSFSESRLTIAAGWVVTICSYSLLIYEFICFVKINLPSKGMLAASIVMCFAIMIAILLYLYSRLMIGNQSDSGSIEFQIKKYEV